MLLIISDASVLIDIEQGGLTSAMFSLPWHFAVPDILFAEELAERHGHFLQSGLISKTMNGDLINEAYILRQQYLRTSVNDLLALILAKHENCQLLTGDKALREVAAKLNVEVHGTIWLVNEMLHRNKITIDSARIASQQMKNTGSRLPWHEVEKILTSDSNSNVSSSMTTNREDRPTSPGLRWFEGKKQVSYIRGGDYTHPGEEKAIEDTLNRFSKDKDRLILEDYFSLISKMFRLQ